MIIIHLYLQFKTRYKLFIKRGEIIIISLIMVNNNHHDDDDNKILNWIMIKIIFKKRKDIWPPLLKKFYEIFCALRSFRLKLYCKLSTNPSKHTCEYNINNGGILVKLILWWKIGINFSYDNETSNRSSSNTNAFFHGKVVSFSLEQLLLN